MRVLSSIYLFLMTQVSYAAVAVDSGKPKNIASLTSEPVGLGNYLQMFFGLFDLIKQGYFKPSTKILVIHTGGLQGLRGFEQLI